MLTELYELSYQSATVMLYARHPDVNNPTHFWYAKIHRFVTTRRARAAERNALFRAAKVRQPITTASHDYTQSNTPNQLPLRRDKAKNERGEPGSHELVERDIESSSDWSLVSCSKAADLKDNMQPRLIRAAWKLGYGIRGSERLRGS